MDKDSIVIGSRLYTLDDLVGKINLVNSADADPALKATAATELTALNLFASLCSASALASVAHELRLISTHLASVDSDLDKASSGPDDHPAGMTAEMKLAAANHDHPLMCQLMVSVIQQGKPATYNLGGDRGTLKIFFEQAGAEYTWRFTHEGLEVTEARALALLDSVD